MKLCDEFGRKQIVYGAIQSTYSAGGDGWSIIVCRFIDINNVVDYVKNITGWNVEKHNDNTFSINHSNESIKIISWEEYKRQHNEMSFEEIERTFDEVLVII